MKLSKLDCSRGAPLGRCNRDIENAGAVKMHLQVVLLDSGGYDSGGAIGSGGKRMKRFITHTGEVVADQRLADALSAVADWYVDNAHAVRSEDAYAPHVTEERKEEALREQLLLAERIRTGVEPMGFWLWQRVNTELTGECVAFLPKNERITLCEPK